MIKMPAFIFYTKDIYFIIKEIRKIEFKPLNKKELNMIILHSNLSCL